MLLNRFFFTRSADLFSFNRQMQITKYSTNFQIILDKNINKTDRMNTFVQALPN